MFCLLFCQGEKKESGNEVVLDPPLPRRRHHLPPHRLPPHRLHPLLHPVHHTHQATVGRALAVMVSLPLKSVRLLMV